MHTHTSLYAEAQTAYGLHRHIHTDVGTHTETWDAIPLLYSEKEAWIQILALTSTETQTRAYIRLFGVSCRR